MTTEIFFNNASPFVAELDNQFSSQGVTFSPPLPLQFIPGPGTSSRWLVQAIKAFQSSEGRTDWRIAGQFTEPRHSSIQVQVFHRVSQLDTPIYFEAIGADGSNLGSQTIVIPKGSVLANGLIEVSSANIASFTLDLHSGPADGFGMKALLFDNLHVPHPPDYRVTFDVPEVFLRPGTDTVINASVLRLYGSHGNINFTATSDTPSTFVESVSPSIVGSGNAFQIKVAARSDSPAVAPSPSNVVSVVGHPDETSGGSSYDFTLPVNVLEAFDLEIATMEVTQGIQSFALPVKPVLGVSGKVVYSGVSLVENCHTVVRVFPRFFNTPTGPWHPDFGIRLHGAHTDFFGTLLGELPGSPLWTTQTAIAFSDDPIAQRKSAAPFFILPPSWTTGQIVLRAEIEVSTDMPFGSPALPYFESNPKNNSFELTGISFIKTDIHEISPVKLVIRDSTQPGSGSAALADPNTTMSDVRKIYPIDASKLEILPWNSSLDVTSAYLGSSSAISRGNSILSAIHDAGYRSSSQGFCVGIYSSQFFNGKISNTETYRRTSGVFQNTDLFTAAVFNDATQPRTGACHEIGHLCGRLHTSPNGGAPPPYDNWPPDQLGFLQGVGFDIDLATDANPATDPVMYPQQFGNAATNSFTQLFDFMSYGPRTESSAWISPRGWEETLQFLRPYDDTHPHQPPQAKFAEKLERPENVATVSFWKDEAGNTTIGTTRAVTRDLKPIDSGVESPYKVRLKHHQTQQTIVEGPSFHSQKSCNSETSITQAVLQIATFDDVGAVEIWHKNSLAATQLRPASPPDIRNVSVTAPTVGSEDYILNYTTTTAPSTPLAVHIDLLISSPSEAEVWKHIHSTSHPPHTTYMTISLDQAFMPYHPSTQARVTLSNVFAITSSARTLVPFPSAGSPPSLTILHPKPSTFQVIHAGSSVYLHTEAWDDRRKRVRNEDVVWEVVVDGAAGVEVARGMLGSWKTDRGMTKGMKELFVRAVDYRGRKVEAKVKIWVEAR